MLPASSSTAHARPAEALKRPKGDPLASLSANTLKGPSAAGAPPKQLVIDMSGLPGVTVFAHAESLEVYEGARRELAALEQDYQSDPDYLKRHPELNARMRAILLDWLFEVGQEYALKRETLHVAINYVDRFLSKHSASPSSPPQRGLLKKDLQLLGVAALWIASKVEEILPPPVSDFAMATDSGCTSLQMIDMEKQIVASLSWLLVPPTAHAWANLYLHCLLVNMRARSGAVARVEHSALWNQPSIVPHVQINRVMELLDFAVLDIDSLCFYPSQLAASAIALLINRDSHNTYTLADLELVTHMSCLELKNCMAWMAFTLNLPSNSVGGVVRNGVALGACVEPHTIQRHHPKALDEYYKEMARRGGSKEHPFRHAACKEHLLQTSRRKHSESELDNSELSSLSMEGLDERLRIGALSPVTQISHLMSEMSNSRGRLAKAEVNRLKKHATDENPGKD